MHEAGRAHMLVPVLNFELRGKGVNRGIGSVGGQGALNGNGGRPSHAFPIISPMYGLQRLRFCHLPYAYLSWYDLQLATPEAEVLPPSVCISVMA